MTTDIRLGECIGGAAKENRLVQLIGFPSDEGVRRNGGRPGASEAPAQIMDWLMRMTPCPSVAANFKMELPQQAVEPSTRDTPNSARLKRERHLHLLEHTGALELLECSGDVEKDQEMLGRRVAELLRANIFPVIVGGGHETSFGHFLGYSLAQKGVRIVNLDAHADVRPLKNGLAHSGSPFYQALTHASGFCKGYSVCGLNSFSVAEEHVQFILSRGGGVHFGVPDVEQLQNVLSEGDRVQKGGGLSEGDRVQKGGGLLEGDRLQKGGGLLEGDRVQQDDGVMMTFDMDVVHQADAPGVSAPNPAGIRAERWIELVRTAARHPSVTSIDLCEVNPHFDRDHQTVRLAALTLWCILDELSERLV